MLGGYIDRSTEARILTSDTGDVENVPGSLAGPMAKEVGHSKLGRTDWMRQVDIH